MTFSVTATLGLAFLLAAPPEAKPVPKFKLGKETTYIVEPLDKDGYLDYETALNERLRGKTTPETNAVVLLMQAIGPKPEGKELHADWWKWLGVKAPPETGDYFRAMPKSLEFHADESRLNWTPWTAKDYPEFAEWLKENEKPLASAVRATERKEYFNPIVSRTKAGERNVIMGAPLAHVQGSRRIAVALAKRAMMKAGEENFDGAWSDLLALHRLARLTGRGGTAIELIVAIAIEGIAAKADLAFLERAKPDAKRCVGYLKDLQQLPPMSVFAEKFDLNERFMFLDAVQHTRRTGMDGLRRLSSDGDYVPPEKPDDDEEKSLALLDWSRIFQIGNRQYDNLGTALRLKTYAERRKALVAVEDDVQELRRNAGFGVVLTDTKAFSERTGTILIGLMLPAGKNFNRAAAQAEQTTRNLQIAFALAAFRVDRGKYPAKLDDLAPKYLAKIPNDLYIEKPLNYKPNDTGYVLYSVGENGREDGGKGREDDPAGDDLTVRMPAAKRMDK